jgi:hypothetical protein
MERITGKQAQTLVEAYAAVYTPQELTEEQVWEGVEEWVNALLEEGYDLSDYTWEEMYEDYLNEGSSEANPPSAAEARKDEADPRRNQAPTRSSQYGSEANPPSAADAKKAEEDPRKPGTPDPRFPTPFERRRRNLETGSRKSGESLADFAKRQSQNLEKDFPSTAATAATPNTAERSTAAATPNTAGAPAKPSPTPSPSPAPSRSSSSATASTADKIKGGMDVYNKQRSSGDFKGASETGKSVWALANPKLAAAAAEKARIRGTSQSDNPLMKGMPGKRPMTPSVQSPTLAKDLGKGSGNQSLLDNPNASKAAPPKAAPTTAPKPTATPARNGFGVSAAPIAAKASVATTTATPTPAAAKPATPKPSLQDTIKKNRGITSSFDLFDLVKGHLLDEGYAESEDAAMVIMANMSEEWRQSIVNENLGNFVRTAGEVIRNPIRAINSLGRDPNLTKRAPDDPRLVDVSTADKAARNLPGSRVYQQRQQQMNR